MYPKKIVGDCCIVNAQCNVSLTLYEASLRGQLVNTRRVVLDCQNLRCFRQEVFITIAAEFNHDRPIAIVGVDPTSHDYIWLSSIDPGFIFFSTLKEAVENENPWPRQTYFPSALTN